MSDIQPGPETDRAVAEAIGLKVITRSEAIRKCNDWQNVWCPEHGISVGPDFKHWFTNNFYIDGPPSAAGLDPVPKYSTDLNAAFEAASRAFDKYIGDDTRFVVYYQPYENLPDWWAAIETDNPFEGWGATLEAGAPTPALAICAAILKLKETT